MASSPTPASAKPGASQELLEQSVLGSRRLSNVLVAGAVTIGGLGFLLASVSSYTGLDLLPLGEPSSLIWVPQGLVMGLYGLAAALLATYLWTVIGIDVGSGTNRFDRARGELVVTRQGFRQLITVEVPMKDIQAVKVECAMASAPAVAWPCVFRVAATCP